MPATATPLPQSPARTADPAIQAALAELLQLGLAVARVASHLAEAEDGIVAALAEAATEATRAAQAPQPSLAHAIEAGRTADSSDVARAAVAARVASIAESFEKAARAVRRTAALQARLAEGRPFREPSSHGRPAPVPTPDRQPANDTRSEAERPDRPDRPERGDELNGKPDKDVIRDIGRDLDTARSRLAPLSPTPTPPAPGAPTPMPHPPPTRPEPPRPTDPGRAPDT